LETEARLRAQRLQQKTLRAESEVRRAEAEAEAACRLVDAEAERTAAEARSLEQADKRAGYVLWIGGATLMAGTTCLIISPSVWGASALIPSSGVFAWEILRLLRRPGRSG
jgi:hypothetical protein